jgi:hypothetical protein
MVKYAATRAVRLVVQTPQMKQYALMLLEEAESPRLLLQEPEAETGNSTRQYGQPQAPSP